MTARRPANSAASSGKGCIYLAKSQDPGKRTCMLSEPSAGRVSLWKDFQPSATIFAILNRFGQAKTQTSAGTRSIIRKPTCVIAEGKHTMHEPGTYRFQ